MEAVRCWVWIFSGIAHLVNIHVSIYLESFSPVIIKILGRVKEVLKRSHNYL